MSKQNLHACLRSKHHKNCHNPAFNSDNVATIIIQSANTQLIISANLKYLNVSVVKGSHQQAICFRNVKKKKNLFHTSETNGLIIAVLYSRNLKLLDLL